MIELFLLAILLAQVGILLWLTWKETEWIRKAPTEIIFWEAYKRGMISKEEYEQLKRR